MYGCRPTSVDHMKPLLALLLICALPFAAEARPVSWLSYQQMFDQADLVALAQPIATNATAEQTLLPNIRPPINVVGVETRFAVQTMLKGDKSTKEFVLHHYSETNH